MIDIIGLVKPFAPTIAGVLASAVPGGPLVKSAITTALSVFNQQPSGDDTFNAHALAKALKSANETQLEALRKIDLNFKLDMQKVGVDILELDNKDRADARKMQTSIGGRSVPILAILVTVGFFGISGAVFYLPAEMFVGQKAAMSGAIIAASASSFHQMLSYFFGSSAGADHVKQTMGEKS